MAGRIKICPYCHTENDANNVSCEECDSDLSRVKSIKKEDSGSAGVNLSDKEADSASAPQEKRDVKPLPDTDNAPLAEATVQPPQVTSDSAPEEKAVVMEAVTSSQEAKNTSYPETDNAKTSAPAISPYDSHGRLLYSKECPFCHHINRGVAKICAGCGENIKRIKPVLSPEAYMASAEHAAVPAAVPETSAERQAAPAENPIPQEIAASAYKERKSAAVVIDSASAAENSTGSSDVFSAQVQGPKPVIPKQVKNDAYVSPSPVPSVENAPQIKGWEDGSNDNAEGEYELITVRICPKCQTQNKDTAFICHKCATDISNIPPSTIKKPKITRGFVTTPKKPAVVQKLVDVNNRTLFIFNTDKTPVIVVGREHELSEYFGGCSYTSRKHAEITCYGTRMSIKDLGSTNGTFVNNKKIEPMVQKMLENHDRISLGGHFNTDGVASFIVEYS